MTDRTPEMEHKENRLSALEAWRSQMDIATAVRDEQYRGIKEDLKSIKGTLSRLAWLMITGIAMGFVAFMINGGFKVP